MFDIGASELLLIVVIAIVVIGPKDMPLALRTAGRWIGRMRRISGQFRAGLDAMIREAEMEEMEKQWREQNAAIMAKHPATQDDDAPAPALPEPEEAGANAAGGDAPNAVMDGEEAPVPGPGTSEGGGDTVATAAVKPVKVEQAKVASDVPDPNLDPGGDAPGAARPTEEPRLPYAERKTPR